VVPSPAAATEKCLDRFVRRRQVIPEQHAFRKREPVPSGVAYHQEGSSLFERVADPKNQELPRSRRVRGSMGDQQGS